MNQCTEDHPQLAQEFDRFAYQRKIFGKAVQHLGPNVILHLVHLSMHLNFFNNEFNSKLSPIEYI